MTDEPISIADAMAKAISTARQPANAVAKTSTTALPVLPNDLIRCIEYAAPNRHADRDGNVLVIARDMEFHPDAARYADEMRCALLPAPNDVIRVWFDGLVKATAPGSIGLDSLFEALLEACADLPAPVWCAAARSQLVRTYKFLPGIAEIYPVLQAIAEPLHEQLKGLERVASVRPRIYPLRPEPVEPYRPVACTPLKQQRSPKLPLRAVVDDFDPDEAARQDKVARLSARDQIAALGVTPAS